MASLITEKTVQQFVRDIGDQHHALSGTVIAASAAQAAALGEACMQISLDNQVDKLDWHDVTTRIERMVHFKGTLLDWADRDAAAVAESGNRLSHAEQPKNLQMLFEGPAEITRLCLGAIIDLNDFRPLVLEQLEGSLNIAARLLLGGAETAVLLLQHNLSRWQFPQYSEKYEPILAELRRQVDHISSDVRS